MIELPTRHFGRYLKTSRTVNSALTNVVNSRNLERTRKPAFISSILNPETLHLASLLRGNYVREAGRNRSLRSWREGIVCQTILVWISMNSRGSPVQGGGKIGTTVCRTWRYVWLRWWLRSLTIDTRYVTSVVACPWGGSTISRDISFVPVHVAQFKKKKKRNATEKMIQNDDMFGYCRNNNRSITLFNARWSIWFKILAKTHRWRYY